MQVVEPVRISRLPNVRLDRGGSRIGLDDVNVVVLGLGTLFQLAAAHRKKLNGGGGHFDSTTQETTTVANQVS